MACTGCVITVDDRPVYGLVVVAAEALRFQVWTQEWDDLAAVEGQTVAVKVPGLMKEAWYLVASVVAVPDTGNTWVHFTAPVEARRKAVEKIAPKVRLLSGGR